MINEAASLSRKNDTAKGRDRRFLMDRAVVSGLRRVAMKVLIFHALAMSCSFSSAQAKSPALWPIDGPTSPRGWILKAQSDEPLSPDQEDVLKRLLETPIDTDLKVVLQLYLDRNQKLSDEDFQTFSSILNTVLELEKLEKQRALDQKAEKPNAPETPDNPGQSPASDEKNPPVSPPVDLDLLYHGPAPMRPL